MNVVYVVAHAKTYYQRVDMKQLRRKNLDKNRAR